MLAVGLGASVVLAGPGAAGQTVPVPISAPEARTPAPVLEPLVLEPDESLRPYCQGEPVPAGYHVESGFHTGFLAGGTAAALSGYMFDVVLARASALHASGGAHRPAYNWPLYAPLVGPFVAAAQPERSGGEQALLAVTGTVQLGGLVLAMLGLGMRELELVRDEVVEPVQVGFGPAGLALAASF
jgi:hypothetical protein